MNVVSKNPARPRMFLAVAATALVLVTAREGNGTTSRAFFPSPSNAEKILLLPGSGGSMHAAFHSLDPAAPGAYYSYCASNCGNPANWTGLVVGTVGFFGGGVRLELTPQGQPRMMWLHDNPSIGNTYQYAECNSGCTNIANWTQVGVVDRVYGGYFRHTRYFALDAQGRPRFLYNDGAVGGGTWYYSCDSSCTTAANWQATRISTADLDKYSLVFDALSRPRLGYADTGYFGYAACDSGCSSVANWTLLPLYTLGSGSSVALRLDSSGRPRFAFYEGFLGTGVTGDELLGYAWCDANCTADFANWTGIYPGFPRYHGLGAELVIDATNRPRLAYYVDTSPYGVAYARCTGACESFAPIWESAFVETSDDLQASNPVPPEPGCSISVWFPGENPSLALDAAGNPMIGYDAKHTQGGSCSVHDDIRLVRFAIVAQSATASGSILDYDRDGRSDHTVFHSSSGTWYMRNSTNGAVSAVGFGGPGYTLVPGDYDGDGITDLGAYHPPSGLWFIRNSTTMTTTTTGFGGPDYKPVRGDFDGDGKTDVAVFHDPSGLWFVKRSSTGAVDTTGYGASGYVPVPADYDGDGKTDLGVYHPPSGLWYTRSSATGATSTTGFGGTAYKPVRGDFDGDGKDDIAVYHESSGLWFIKRSSTGAVDTVGYGGTGYVPVPGRYDADGKTDVAVYHQPSGLWFMKSSVTGASSNIGFGGPGYTPVN